MKATEWEFVVEESFKLAAEPFFLGAFLAGAGEGAQPAVAALTRRPARRRVAHQQHSVRAPPTHQPARTSVG